MPFDGTAADDATDALVGVFDRALAFLDCEDNWCKGDLRSGHRRCLIGALQDAAFMCTTASSGESRWVGNLLVRMAQQRMGRLYGSTSYFNDDPCTTHADVLAVLRATRERLRYRNAS